MEKYSFETIEDAVKFIEERKGSKFMSPGTWYNNKWRMTLKYVAELERWIVTERYVRE